MAGHEVETVTDARAILDTLRRQGAETLLQDARMPGLDLAAHVKAVRGDPQLRGTRLVLVTGDAEALSSATELGIDACLQKPFQPDHLLRVLKAP